MEEDYEKFPDHTGAFILALLFGAGLFIGLCMFGTTENTIWLGDEVMTSDRYTELSTTRSADGWLPRTMACTP